MAAETTSAARRPVRWIAPPTGWSRAIAAGISTRQGGVSRQALAELNLGARTGDHPEHLRVNLARLAAATGVPLAGSARARLEHGVRICVVREPGETPTGDGLLTDRPELPLTLTVADCVPLFLALSGRAVALIHCGWRGVAGGIVAAGVQAITAFTGTAAEEIDAWIGPSIGPCCHWLPAEDAASLPAAARLGERPADGLRATWRIDLPGAAVAQLTAAGLTPERIQATRLCTACHAKLFFSHRRDRGTTGRMLAWIMRRAP
ncbi:MAG: laccase domain-containing protein [Candidatus Eisenbacteria sp.]|nr:laccase domain-containing protein [Candidatus Eisenbacteria bacterium]